MKKIFTGFFIGTLLTASIFFSLHVMSDNSSATETLDMLINEWTDVHSDSSIINISAQLPAYKELPNARPGYFPDTVLSLALSVQSLYNVPKGVTLAQWALESSWGRNNLGVSNYFGHTFNATKKFMVQPKATTRRELISIEQQNRIGQQMSFSVYRNIAECFDVHGQYLSHSRLYKHAFEQRLYNAPEKFARAIASTYATDPDYALKLITIMRRYKLH